MLVKLKLRGFVSEIFFYSFLNATISHKNGFCLHLKIKLIYNQFSPHLNSDLQVFLPGSNRIREIMCCSSCSLKQNPSQTCAYGARCFRDQTNTFTLLYIFLLILNLYVLLTRNLKKKKKSYNNLLIT